MFLQNMLIAARQVGILYIMVLIGVIADKTGFYTEGVAKKCTDLLFYIITPAKILESFFTLEYSRKALIGLLVAIGAGLAMHTFAALVTLPFFNKETPEKAAVYKYAAVYGNCGYMGLPLVDAVVGASGVFYCSAVIISFQIFTFTHGVWLMTKDSGDAGKKFDFKKIILNPGVLPVFVGLPVFISGLRLPSLILSPIESIAGMNSPLAMLIFGTYVANTDFRSIFGHAKITGVALVKLILLPLAMIGALKLLGIGGELGATLVVVSATPPANNTILFASKYERDTSLASQTVAVLSLISILTLPVMIALGSAVLN
ncbi:MAG: AEC family transporter [Clostridia bacterium]|nr:AEC family transporter [Clostridia bacterium]